MIGRMIALASRLLLATHPVVVRLYSAILRAVRNVLRALDEECDVWVRRQRQVALTFWRHPKIPSATCSGVSIASIGSPSVRSASWRNMGVSTQAGYTVVIPIPVPYSSVLIAIEKPRTAHLLAQYPESNGTPACPALS